MIPLVLVHGFMGGSDQWEPQSPLKNTVPLIAVDLPGFGKNAHLAPINSIEKLARWVLNELTDQGVERFLLLGHSMGGMVVQDMIRQAPDRVARLVLYSTGALGLLPGRFEPIETSMQRAKDDGAKATARRIAASWFLHRENAKAYPACAAIAECSSPDAIQAGLEAMRDWSGEDSLSYISAPTLIIWGDQDRTYPWPQIQTLWQSVPESSLAVIPGCAHAVHLEEPEIFNHLLERFIHEGDPID
ncbi:alpha/beta hydrolase [Labrenzia sp. R4_2]|uniref:alpha/beta fold hydrolase n=1 Tax=Labrenzia sp. R4_2 TaxID=2821107 RepID=UPI001ADBC60D|nr:alpha/beta hydrolase [Labrenzia sp. R4_2]MBO9420812.1 alpha/beta hydrolase [Labrenzia sp. R4_2]